jgi:hypothetical protein
LNKRWPLSSDKDGKMSMKKEVITEEGQFCRCMDENSLLKTVKESFTEEE